MRPKQSGVQSGAADPLQDEAGVLAGRQTALRTTMAGKQELARPFGADALYVVNDALGSFLLRASEVIHQVPMSACGTYCCKIRKLQRSEFLART